MGLGNSSKLLGFFIKESWDLKKNLRICSGKQELAKTCRGKNPRVLKLAVDSVNLGLCDSRDCLACP